MKQLLAALVVVVIAICGIAAHAQDLASKNREEIQQLARIASAKLSEDQWQKLVQRAVKHRVEDFEETQSGSPCRAFTPMHLFACMVSFFGDDVWDGDNRRATIRYTDIRVEIGRQWDADLRREVGVSTTDPDTIFSVEFVDMNPTFHVSRGDKLVFSVTNARGWRYAVTFPLESDNPELQAERELENVRMGGQRVPWVEADCRGRESSDAEWGFLLRYNSLVIMPPKDPSSRGHYDKMMYWYNKR